MLKTGYYIWLILGATVGMGLLWMLVVNGTVVLDATTIASGRMITIEYFNVAVMVITTEWTSGSYDSECSFGMYNRQEF